MKEYVDTFERVVQHPTFKAKFNEFRSIHRDTKDAMKTAAEQSREEGAYNAKVDIASTLLKRGFSVTDVARKTKLTESEVRQLKENIVK